jgi:hypothetical protein
LLVSYLNVKYKVSLLTLVVVVLVAATL